MGKPRPADVAATSQRPRWRGGRDYPPHAFAKRTGSQGNRAAPAPRGTSIIFVHQEDWRARTRAPTHTQRQKKLGFPQNAERKECHSFPFRMIGRLSPYICFSYSSSQIVCFLWRYDSLVSSFVSILQGISQQFACIRIPAGFMFLCVCLHLIVFLLPVTFSFSQF